MVAVGVLAATVDRERLVGWSCSTREHD
jgi:hypothetical protein